MIDEDPISPAHESIDVDMEHRDNEYEVDYGDLEDYEGLESLPDAPIPLPVVDDKTSRLTKAQRLAAINAELEALKAIPDSDDESAMSEVTVKMTVPTAKVAQPAAPAVARPVAPAIAAPARLPRFKKKEVTQPASASKPAKRAHDEVEGAPTEPPRAAPSTRVAASASASVKTTGRSSGGKEDKEAEAPTRPSPEIDIDAAKSYAVNLPKTNNKPTKPALADRIGNKTFADEKPESTDSIMEDDTEEVIPPGSVAEVIPPGSAAPHVIEMRPSVLVPWVKQYSPSKVYRFGLRLVNGEFVEAHVLAFGICRSIVTVYPGRVLFAVVCSDIPTYQRMFKPHEDDYNFVWERMKYNEHTTVEDVRALTLRNRIHPRELEISRPWAIEVLLTVEHDTRLPPHIRNAANEALHKMIREPIPVPDFKWRSPRWVAALEHVRSNPKKHGSSSSSTTPSTSAPSNEEDQIEIVSASAVGNETASPAKRAPARAPAKPRPKYQPKKKDDDATV